MLPATILSTPQTLCSNPPGWRYPPVARHTAKVARTRNSFASITETVLSPRFDTTTLAPSRRNPRQSGRSAHSHIADDNLLVEIDHRNIGRPRIRHITALAIFRNVDEVRPAMNSDRRHHGVLLGIDHADVVRPRVDHIDFVLLAVGRDPSRLHAHRNGLRRLKRPQINHAHRIALPVRDVGILAVRGPVIRQSLLAEIPPAQRRPAVESEQ